jgi:dTDP-4-amino-4,6-dideoxygalactose transaminase
MDGAEIDAAVRVPRSRSLFRYCGLDLQKEAESLEVELARYTGAAQALAVSSGAAAQDERDAGWCHRVHQRRAKGGRQPRSL